MGQSKISNFDESIERKFDFAYDNAKEYSIWRTQLIEWLNIKKSRVSNLHEILLEWNSEGKIRYNFKQKSGWTNAWEIQILTLSKDEWYEEFIEHVDSADIKSMDLRERYDYSKELSFKIPIYLDQIKKLKANGDTWSEIAKKFNLQDFTINQLSKILRNAENYGTIKSIKTADWKRLLEDDDYKMLCVEYTEDFVRIKNLRYERDKDSMGFLRHYIGVNLAQDNGFVLMLAKSVWNEIERNQFYVQDLACEWISLTAISEEFKKEGVMTLKILGSGNDPVIRMETGNWGRGTGYRFQGGQILSDSSFYDPDLGIDLRREKIVVGIEDGWIVAGFRKRKDGIAAELTAEQKSRLSFEALKHDKYALGEEKEKIALQKGFFQVRESIRLEKLIVPRGLLGKSILYKDNDDARRKVAAHILKKMKEEKIQNHKWWWVEDGKLKNELYNMDDHVVSELNCQFCGEIISYQDGVSSRKAREKQMCNKCQMLTKEQNDEDFEEKLKKLD